MMIAFKIVAIASGKGLASADSEAGMQLVNSQLSSCDEAIVTLEAALLTTANKWFAAKRGERHGKVEWAVKVHVTNLVTFETCADRLAQLNTQLDCADDSQLVERLQRDIDRVHLAERDYC